MNLQEIFRRFLRNATMIVGSRLIFGLLNLATSALVVRAFGLPELGILVLLQVYVRLFSNFMKFDSWQAVLSFGTSLYEKENARELRSLIGFTFGVDLASAAIGITGAILLIPYAAGLFEWPERVTGFAPFFALSILFMVQGTPNGVLRLVNRVDVLAWEFALNATIRFLGVLLVMAVGGGLFELVLVWFAANTLSGFYTTFFCFLELKARNLMPLFDVNWHRAGERYDRIWRFLVFNNISTSLNFLYDGGSVTIVGAVLGPAAAATLQIVKQFSGAISRPTSILGPLISPEFAKLASSGDWVMFQSLIKRQLLITAAVLGVLTAVLFAVLGYVIDAVYGKELTQYLPLFQIFVFGSILTMATFSFEPAVLAVNKPTLVLGVKGVALVLYILVTVILYRDYRLYAFAFGFLASQTAYVILFSLLGMRLLKRRLRKTIS